MLILGTSQFIKDKFGVGYNLTITCKDSSHLNQFLNQKQDLIDYVKSLVPNAAHDIQSLKDTVKLLLPFESVDAFSDLLSNLESNPIINVNFIQKIQLTSIIDSRPTPPPPP